MTNQEQQSRVAHSKSASSATTIAAAAATATPTATSVKIELSDKLNQQQQRSTMSTDTTTTSTTTMTGANCCASCLMPIKDRFIFNVINQNFHQECVRCADCAVGLNEKCFTQDGKLYCRLDYWRRFGPKCSACSESIKPTEFVQKLKQDLIYHLSCFVCQDCKRHLQAGEQLHLLEDKRILCKRDFLNSQNSHNNHQNQTTTTSTTGPAMAAVQDRTDAKVTANQTSGGPQQPGLKSAANMLNGACGKSQSVEQQQSNNQENSYQHQHDEQLVTTAGANAQLTRVQVMERNTSNSNSSAHLIDERLGGSNNSNEEVELDDLEADDMDEDGASSIGTGETDQFQASLTSNNYSQATQPQQQQKLNSTTTTATGSNAMKFDPSDLGQDDLVDANGKRRGPRTTIKPTQLETLRHAFESAPKPSRHIREQLAAETGLNMRVIQVWFQNRRSKERRMRNSNGSARRNFLRSQSRRLRVGPQTLQNQAGLGPAGAGLTSSSGSLIATGASNKDTTARGVAINGKQAKGSASSSSSSSSAGSNSAAAATARYQRGSTSPTEANGGANKSNQSVSDFGGSSSTSGGGAAANSGAGFTYFSDSSNQGNETSFAALASLSANSGNPANQQQYSQQQHSPPESVGSSLTPTSAATAAANGNGNTNAGLMGVESPSGVSLQHSSSGVAVAGAKGSNAPVNQQQYQTSPMKNTPPPIYQQPQIIGHHQHQQQQLLGAPQQHFMMQPQHMSNSHHQAPQQHHFHQAHNQTHHHQHHHQLHHSHLMDSVHQNHHLSHHAHHQMVPPGGMLNSGGPLPAGLMPAHQAQAGPPSVVQW